MIFRVLRVLCVKYFHYVKQILFVKSFFHFIFYQQLNYDCIPQGASRFVLLQ